jgi:Effector-associated domain 11
MQARQILEDLIAQGQLEQAIETYLSLSRQYGDEARTNQGLHESGRFHALKEKNITGTISQADYQLEWNLINRSVLTQASKVPNTWKYPFEPLATPPPATPSATPADAPPPAQKSFLERWGLILGLMASLTTILGITLKDLIFPPKPEPQPVVINPQPTPSTTTSVPVPTTTQEAKKEPTTNPSAQPKHNNTPNPVTTQPKTTPTTTKPSPTTTAQQEPSITTSTSPVTTNTPPSTTSAPPVNNNIKPRFRSFSKLVIIEDMERGHDGNNRIMYRNVRTNEVLCCYDEGENFSGGKARVSQNGQYFYIDKKGNRVQ